MLDDFRPIGRLVRFRGDGTGTLSTSAGDAGGTVT